MSRKRFAWTALVLIMVLGHIFFQHLAAVYGQEKEEEEKPDRLVVMAVEYPGVVVPQEEDVSMDIIFYNKGKSDETVNVEVASVPKGWEARVKTYRFTITGVHVPSGEDKTVTFEAEPDENVKPGRYEFRIAAQTPDRKFKMAETVAVTVKEKEEGKKESKGVKLTTSYPVLRGPSDAQFEFSVEVDSKLNEDAVFDLFAQGPEGWDLNFKPSFEDKFISSLRIQANQSKTVAVQVKPSMLAQEGEYPVNIRVSSGDAKAEAELTVALTGTYDLEAGTPTGLLSLDARQGKPANMSFYVKNTGSAPNNDIRFMSFKPENWKLEFNPETIPVLEPGDLKQVEVMITPYEEALVGDYSVGVDIQGEKASKNLEFRISVRASTAWGYIGIFIIVVVIAGLLGLFRWLGRR
ncbi:MAG: hypothetical protein GTN74_08940 [Proteobacteria bacterium]|nr:hypothetical protein [Pseudomonadota bacterium]NIS70046.1 hypothetical protein [Pseudomonadota bacterium]